MLKDPRQQVVIGVDAVQFFNSNERMWEGAVNDGRDKLHWNATYKSGVDASVDVSIVSIELYTHTHTRTLF
jgi:hypothetical protein